MGVFHQALIKIENALAYIRKDRSAYYRFGENDCLPNDNIRIVNDSGTGRACITKLSQFIQANGLADTTLGEFKANPDQSYNSVISELSIIVSYFKASCFRVMYNNSGHPAIIYPVPCQKLRRYGRYTFAFNDLMGEQGRRREEDKILNAYNPKEEIPDRMNRLDLQIKKYGEQLGDIVYHFKKGVGLYHDVYSIPDYYSGIDDIQSDAGISRLELRNIKKGWRPSVIISGGPIDDVLQDGNGLTAWGRFSRDMKSFTGEEGATAVYISGATPEAQPKVTTINVADMLDQTDKSTDRLGRKVCRIMGVPPILVGFATAGQLGNLQELENTMNLFKMTVIESQDLIKESLRMVFPDKNWDLTTLNLWETVKPVSNEAGIV